MPVTVQPSFGGFDYAAENCDIEKWREEDQIRGAVATIPRSDQAQAVDGFLSPRGITADGYIGGDTFSSRDDLRAALDAFKWAHRPGFRQLFRDADRYLTAEVRSLTVGDDTGLLWVPYSIRFEAADPFWYSSAADADTWAAPATGGTHALNNGGAATALPIFTFMFGSTATLALTLTDTTTGDSFDLAGAVASGDVLIVNCAAQTVTLNAANKMSYFDGDFFPLNPGNNTLQVTYSGPSLSSLHTDWTKRWL